ncbi:MarR family winged helix-turn-helix transcriptional regulator [Solibacillus sp. FSL H8-0538]|uniref:MarR family winged helix-turn-helix transcriptional regulator n=1 Tax=Solibacillus sp. FSL H8-0538 TaxID=2921400 RepID=UPI0030F8E13A
MEKKSIFQLIHMIEQVRNENIVRFTREFPYPVSISPILVLGELRAKGPRKQVDLAEVIGYTKGAMTNIATKLVDLGLAERLYDDNDRRTIHLQITPKGIEALKEAQKIGEKLYIELFEVFDDEELKQYINLQKKLIANMKNKKL